MAVSIDSPVVSDLTVRLDWLQFTVPRFEDMGSFRRFAHSIADDLDDDLVSLSHGVTQGRFYECSARSPRGLLVAYNRPEGNISGDGFVGIPGRALRSRSGRDHWRLCAYLSSQSYFPINWTRLDIALDDYSKELIPSPHVFHQVAESRSYTSFRTHSFTGSSHSDSASPSNLTVYFGSRDSDRFVRAYDKDAESFGLIPAHRLELVSRGDFASAVVNRFLSNDYYADTVSWDLTGWFPKAVQFVDRSLDPNETHLDRLPRLPWWDKLLSRLGAVDYAPRTKVSLLADKLRWLDHQVSPSLALVREVYGIHFEKYLSTLLDGGLERLTEDQWSLIRLARAESMTSVQPSRN